MTPFTEDWFFCQYKEQLEQLFGIKDVYPSKTTYWFKQFVMLMTGQNDADIDLRAKEAFHRISLPTTPHSAW